MFIAVLIATMLVSTVMCVPATEGRIINRVTNRLEIFNRKVLGDSKYERIKDILHNKTSNIRYALYSEQKPIPLSNNDSTIAKLRAFSINVLGQNEYEQMKLEVESKLKGIEYRLNSTSYWNNFHDFYEFLIEITIAIFSMCTLLFGHNAVSYIMGLTLFMFVMPIPVYIVSILDCWFQIILDFTDGVLGEPLLFEDIIYNFGIAGILIALAFALPVALTFMFVGVPILAVLNTFDIMLLLLNEF